MDDQRIMGRPALGLVYRGNGGVTARVCRQAVNRFCRDRDKLAAVEQSRGAFNIGGSLAQYLSCGSFHIDLGFVQLRGQPGAAHHKHNKAEAPWHIAHLWTIFNS